MLLNKVASRMTLRGIVLIIILFVVTINAAHASDPGRWLYDLFRSSVHVEFYDDDGSGIAIGPEGETIDFCVRGEPCDTKVPAPAIGSTTYMPVISTDSASSTSGTDLPTITVKRRRPIH